MILKMHHTAKRDCRTFVMGQLAKDIARTPLSEEDPSVCLKTTPLLLRSIFYLFLRPIRKYFVAPYLVEVQFTAVTSLANIPF